ncbi:TPA_asm: hypothetical protein [ssRNA phage SRR7976310_3]|uniref:Uncharacterized protein n=1 Tax=ssRNA phage SRR7976310_3 TaxID=2786681 RepID=A0A8S5L565_9VIRU|nr:hypothetical protein QIN28_gp1 [ssRNA phage SRR7976310_3]DAD52699.1 TPA_asm: hypothetical protein [ssRNA phage SRR7976310_3]
MSENLGLTNESIQMLIASVTRSEAAQLSELEAERLLNAIARVQSGVPTGSIVNRPQPNNGQGTAQ